MDFTFLTNQSDEKNDPVSFLKGGGKYEAIKNKLCDKRRNLEQQITATTGNERDEYALELMRLKESMRTFGVDEIAYQVYMEKEGRPLH
jgi:hypothetical protein